MNSTENSDENFKILIEIEIKDFLAKNKNNCVLLFPPVNNYHRFLIHKSCENFEELVTFSVGSGIERRTVVCFKDRLLVPLESIASNNIARRKTLRNELNLRKRKDISMVVEPKTLCCKNETNEPSNKYVPPAFRNKDLSTLDTNDTSSNNKEPNEENSDVSVNKNSTNNRPTKRERRPDRAVYIPRQLRPENSLNRNSNKLKADEKCNLTKANCDKNKSPIDIENKSNLDLSLHDSKKKSLNSNCDNIENPFDVISSNNNPINMNKTSSTKAKKENRKNESLIMRVESTEKSSKEDKEAEELERASKEINRSNRRIIKQTFNSNILEIPEKVNDSQNDSVEKDVNEDQINGRIIDPEKDDWDTIFDDNGECFDKNLISELTASVGNVQIEEPKADYTEYLLKQAILNEEEFPHVLEISNFPVEFKTQDLMMIFSTYKESGFDIKWVDDTHALAVFSSSRIAAEVLAMNHPFVILKPLTKATVESRNKAKKYSSSLQPYRTRPETCTALARRLVSGALGVRLKTAAQERENEIRVLKEAKERKLQAAKLRDEAWES